MSARDDDRLDDALALWTAAEPPAGFADDVLTALDAPPAPAGRRWLTWAAAALAAAVTWGLHRLPPLPTDGALSTAGAVSLGDRAAAVGDPHTELTWSVALGGAVTARQQRGRVFYRVEPGVSFAVETPAGRIEARGTCFEIELLSGDALGERRDAMARGLISHMGAGLAGAALATVAFVTVYEGRVSVAAEGPPATLSAGERGALTSGRAVIPLPARDAPTATAPTAGPPPTRARPDRRPGTDAAELERLRAQIAALEDALEDEQSIRAEQEGDAFAFPPDLPEAFTEEGLRAAFDGGFEAVGLDGRVLGIDCSEYPCIVYGEAEYAGDDREALDTRFRALNEALTERYGSEAQTAYNTSVWGATKTDDDGRTVQNNRFAFAPYPKDSIDPDASEAMLRRLRFRHEQSRALQAP